MAETPIPLRGIFGSVSEASRARPRGHAHVAIRYSGWGTTSDGDMPMPRVVPSQVVALIDQNFPSAKSNARFDVYSASAGVLSAIVRLVSEIPPELLIIAADDYSNLVCGVEGLNSAVVKWHQRGGDDPPAAISGVSPIAAIRAALAKCPDESPSPTTATLAFITDAALRDSIRLDISAGNRDMTNGEWKGATVLAGSATEALLLWSIQQAETRKVGTIAAAVAALVASKTLPQKPDNNPERWNFIELIEAAVQLTQIKDDTGKQARLCKDFRNLIHPGRAARLGQVCDRGTALSALAAVELVVRDLTP